MGIAATIKILTLSGLVAAVFLPQTASAAGQEAAAAPPGPIVECLEQTGGNADAFLACLRAQADELGYPEGWEARLRTFLENHPDWQARLRLRADRWEDRRDRREDRRDRREDLRDRWEDRRDHDRDWEDLFDRWEDRRDRREDRWDKWEDRWDRRKGV